jgi:sugar/nucleoside kinase (ribokinase family)
MAPQHALNNTIAGQGEPPSYRLVVGTGGIGSGISVRLEGDHLLGREETRFVTLLEGRDYCKLHNVSHYLQVLVGRNIEILPVGKVGADDAGARLLDEMREVGLNLDFVETVEGQATLYAVAFSYPDGAGGNLTTLHSASDEVKPEDIRSVEGRLRSAFGAGIAVALPEVPLEARRELLRMGRELDFLCVAAFISGEAARVLSEDMLADVDLLILNQDEATAFTGIDVGRATSEFAELAIQALLTRNDRLAIVITAGANGSWSWDGSSLSHVPALADRVVSTAGAGDAHLAGILTGIARGLGLHEANRFGSLISSMKVGSPHTLNAEISWPTVLASAERQSIALPRQLTDSLGEFRD